jgi:hypothetical protein
MGVQLELSLRPSIRFPSGSGSGMEHWIACLLFRFRNWQVILSTTAVVFILLNLVLSIAGVVVPEGIQISILRMIDQIIVR